MYISRRSEETLRDLAAQFPVVVVTGPRQSGKTTLVRQLFSGYTYVSLEDPDDREFAAQDPRGFLARFEGGGILDEVQRVPDLISYLQGHVDEQGDTGQFILSGSQQFGWMEQVTQSLAGRAAVLDLLPFSLDELHESGLVPQDLDRLLFTGLYPPIYDRGIDPSTFYANYVRNYIERDVRQMINVRDLGTFQRFLKLCAGRNGQMLNLSQLGGDAGISHNTARAWLSVLEASYIIHLLPPHHRNFNKRVIKTPKLHFIDPGLCSWLLGIEKADQISTHPLRGPLFESCIVSELLKRRYDGGKRSNLHYWRGRGGLEVDLVIERPEGLDPVEIKAGATIAGDWFRSLHRWTELAGESAGRPFLIYGGDQRLERSGVRVLPWHQASLVQEADLQVRLIPRRLESDLQTQPKERLEQPEEMVPVIRGLFWERDLQAEDFTRYPMWILVRVLNMGSLAQVRATVAFFGEEVLQEALGSRDLEPRAKQFWRTYLRRTA